MSLQVTLTTDSKSLS